MEAIVFHMSLNELNEYANKVKDNIFQDLHYDGIITEAQFKKLSKTKIVTNTKLSSISAFFRRLIRKYPEVDNMRIVVSTSKSLNDEFEEVPIKQEEIREALKKE